MEMPVQNNNSLPDAEMELLQQQLLDAQLALGKDLSSMSQFLRNVLNQANEDLKGIRAQLETIQELTTKMEEWDGAS